MGASGRSTQDSGLRKSEVHKDPPKVLAVLLHSMIETLDVPLIEKLQHPFFQHAAPFSGDDLDQFDAFLDGLVHDPRQFRLDRGAFVEDVMQVKLQLRHVETPKRIVLSAES